MKTKLPFSIALLSLGSMLPSLAAEIDIPDHSFVPDGSGTNDYVQTDIATPNGGNVLPAGASTHIAYVVTTYTFGTGSDAHLESNFRATGGQPRVGVRIQDTGQVSWIGSGDSTQTNFNFSQDMAGQTVTLLIKAHYDPNHNVIYGKTNASDDTLFNVWINPTASSVEGSGQSAGDMQTVWNSATFGFFGTTIQNQSTPGTAGDSSITNTTILTGVDATFANALSMATGGPPPTGIVDPAISTVSASPVAVPADGISTSTVTVTLKEDNGTPVPGKEVSLSGNGSATIETSNNISNSSGVVAFTVKSMDIGAEVFTATDVTDSLGIPQTASVDFQAVGPVDAGNSTVVADPSSVLANGVSTSTVTVTLRDGNGLLVVGEAVTLTGSPSGAMINPDPTQTTDANGEAAFIVSSTTIRTVVFTATSSTDTVTVTQTAGVNFIDPAVQLGINIPDFCLTPDGSTTVGTQDTDIQTLNGGDVLPGGGTSLVYLVSTFTFGTGSDAHMRAQFYRNVPPSAARLGIDVNDDGLVTIQGTSPVPSFDLAQDMAGQTVTLLAKLDYDTTHSTTYGQTNVSNDTIMNVWVNPTASTAEGSGLAAGDLNTIWNSAGFRHLRQSISNQSTPGTAEDSCITNTTILTGDDATFANALALATQEAAPAAPFAITDVVYSPDTSEVTLTWRSKADTSYIAKYSLTMADGWVSDLDDGITSEIDEISGDGDQITVTFDLDAAGIAGEENVFFRIEEE